GTVHSAAISNRVRMPTGCSCQGALASSIVDERSCAIVVSLGRLQPPGLAQRIAQNVFDLRVEAAQLVVGPALRRRQDVGIDAQRVGLLFGNVSAASRCSLTAGQ